VEREQAFRRIQNERERQREQWSGQHAWGKGDCSSLEVEDIVKAAVLMEEAGEVARAVLDGIPLPALVDELTQVAAVAVAWMEAL
jgi:NTP pyrophosphatase (non-canonical NTP hydrolase)